MTFGIFATPIRHISRKVAGREVTKFTSTATPLSPPPLVFSGIQPTGVLHLGNYFGAVEKLVELQNNGEMDVIVSVVDWHALTGKDKSPVGLRKAIFEMTASLLACGIDPHRSILFQQSSVPQHTELCWLFNCLATKARLEGLSHYKDKIKDYGGERGIPMGLLSYPLLQASDILLYKATHVPVGEDQTQHIQLTRHLAEHFAETYKVFFFPIPDQISTKTTRLKSLRHPEKKMSKSDPNTRSRIDITDPPDVILDKMKKAVTDSNPRLEFAPDSRPGVSNLITLHSAVTGLDSGQLVTEAEGLSFGQYKLVVAEKIIEKFEPIRTAYLDIVKDPEYVKKILSEGNMKARNIAEKNMHEIKRIIGVME